MCAACGIATHIPDPGFEERPSAAQPTTAGSTSTSTAAPAAAVKAGAGGMKFAALRNPDCRFYLFGTMLSMMADNVEHVISYWVLYQKFHSPALAGFAVISHWVPSLLFSVYFGSLADRHDCRKVIQVAQVMYMGVSAAWGYLFWTDSLEIWHAVILLIVHGMAGALWSPAEQLMLHDIVGRETLPSAVRLNSTSRSLGILCGPAVGSALLLGLGETWGIWANVLIYLPLTIWLVVMPYTGHLRDTAGVRRPPMTFADAVRVLREVADNPTLISMVALGGVSSLFIGAALGPQMPEFASGLGINEAGLVYGALLAANAAGAVFGGLILEGTGLLRPNARAAMVSTILYSICMIGFALSYSYPFSLVLLVLAGMTNLASQSIAQTLVQLLAPPEKRGRVIGVYNMSSSGLRAGSGVTVGVLGGFIGIHLSLATSAVVLCLITMFLLVYTARAASRMRPATVPLRSTS
ncbi:MAG: MFS transporter [Chloroflexi bacterium]|nr:MFS transporter [Chloroflexota bacterium]